MRVKRVQPSDENSRTCRSCPAFRRRSIDDGIER
jgi:hypothetical protein